MFETVVIATDGSASAERAVRVALDLADRFDATVHALYVVDTGELAGSPEAVRADLESALTTTGNEALTFVQEAADAEPGEVVTAVREGDPAIEVISYAKEHDADLLATGTRGRHGEHSFLLGSVAEAVVRKSPIPVLTVRQLDPAESAADP
ncbi:universal stress protein [Halobacteriales archaeon Cl-PHB]